MYLYIYFIALFIFLIIDALWLGVVARNLYKKEIGFLMKKNINWVAAIVFYLLFILGLTVFVIEPVIVRDGQFLNSLTLGSLFGLVSYATYDLTNLATIKKWPIKVTIIDLAWGSFIGGIVSIITHMIIINLII